jgi:small subunit ribosomal protein S17e
VTILGKVRIGKVKSVSNELVRKYPAAFATEFEANKKLVYQYTDIRSKHLNNRVAGYVTRLLVSQKKREEAMKLEEAEMASKEAETQAPAMEIATEATKDALPEETTGEVSGADEEEQGEDAEVSTDAKAEADGKTEPVVQDATQDKTE